MKIVVLAGGLSTERAVSLVTGAGVCRALRERGHRAILADLFLGLEELPEDPETLFDAADGLCPDAKIETTAPRISLNTFMAFGTPESSVSYVSTSRIQAVG